MERELIKNWFLEHFDDGTVVDYMEDILQDFIRYELASKDELEEEGIEVRVIGDAQNVKPGLKNIEEGYFAGLSI